MINLHLTIVGVVVGWPGSKVYYLALIIYCCIVIDLSSRPIIFQGEEEFYVKLELGFIKNSRNELN